MPEYKYTAIDRNGAQASGKIEAANDEQARQKLMAKGLMVTTLANDGGSAKPAATQAAPAKAGFSFGAKVSQNDVTVMTRQLATLIVAGLQLLRALELITKQERNPAFKAILANVAESVSQGNNLSEALQAHPKVFDKLFVNLIRAGEAGGVLDKVLDRLAKFREKAERIQKKVKSAMVYPGVVMSVAIIIVYILMVKVVPSFQKLLDGQKTQMPPLTQFVVGISKLLTVYWWATPILVFGIYWPEDLAVDGEGQGAVRPRHLPPAQGRRLRADRLGLALRPYVRHAHGVRRADPAVHLDHPRHARQRRHREVARARA